MLMFLHYQEPKYSRKQDLSDVGARWLYCLARNRIGDEKGKTTPVFLQHASMAQFAVEDYCFSIITKQQAVDLEPDNKPTQDKWFHALLELIAPAFNKPHCERKVEIFFVLLFFWFFVLASSHLFLPSIFCSYMTSLVFFVYVNWKFIKKILYSLVFLINRENKRISHDWEETTSFAFKNQ